MDPFPERPRYMHRKTYEKLRRKSLVAEQRALSVIGRRSKSQSKPTSTFGGQCRVTDPHSV